MNTIPTKFSIIRSGRTVSALSWPYNNEFGRYCIVHNLVVSCFLLFIEYYVIENNNKCAKVQLQPETDKYDSDLSPLVKCSCSTAVLLCFVLYLRVILLVGHKREAEFWEFLCCASESFILWYLILNQTDSLDTYERMRKNFSSWNNHVNLCCRILMALWHPILSDYGTLRIKSPISLYTTFTHLKCFFFKFHSALEPLYMHPFISFVRLTTQFTIILINMIFMESVIYRTMLNK